MELKSLTDGSFQSDNFIEDYKGYISFDEDSSELKLKNLKISSSDSDKKLIPEIILIMSGGANNVVNTIVLENVKHSQDKVDFGFSNILVFKSCVMSGDYSFWSRRTNVVKIKDCNVPDFNLSVDIRNLVISRSIVGRVGILSEKNKVNLKSLKVDGGSKINRIPDLDYFIDSGTAIIFSEDSDIEIDAETSYLIMSRVANRFADVVQSNVLHSKSVELFLKQAKGETEWLLKFEKWTNDFGRSVFLPVFWMVFINFLFLMMLKLGSSDVMGINCLDFLVSIFNISPLSSFISNAGPEISWELSLDSLRRMLLAILAYQTVVAARRFSFVKK